MLSKVSTVRNVKLPAESLLIHPTAQRAVSDNHVKRLAAKLDLDAIGTIHAVQYPIGGKSGPWVVDGQHRILALIAAGQGKYLVDITIHLEVKDDIRASELFLHLNRRLSVGPIDTFENELRAKQEEATGINDIVRTNGLKVGRVLSGQTIVCITSLRKSYRIDGGSSLMHALITINAAWGKSGPAHEGKLIEGIVVAIHANPEKIDFKLLAERLAKYPGGPASLVGDAKGRQSYARVGLGRSVAAIVVDLYNARRKGEKIELV